jgi:hypothetical protein
VLSSHTHTTHVPPFCCGRSLGHCGIGFTGSCGQHWMFVDCLPRFPTTRVGGASCLPPRRNSPASVLPPIQQEPECRLNQRPLLELRFDLPPSPKKQSRNTCRTAASIPHRERDT